MNIEDEEEKLTLRGGSQLEISRNGEKHVPKIKVILTLNLNIRNLTIIIGPKHEIFFPLLFISMITYLSIQVNRAIEPIPQKLKEIPTYYKIMLFLHYPFAFLLLLNLFLVSFTSPKHASENLNEGNMMSFFCDKCKISKNYAKRKNVRHCDTCDICVEGYDHHCKLLGNCVGEDNIFFFNSLIFTVVLNFLFNYLVVFLSMWGGYGEEIGNDKEGGFFSGYGKFGFFGMVIKALKGEER